MHIKTFLSVIEIHGFMFEEKYKKNCIVIERTETAASKKKKEKEKKNNEDTILCNKNNVIHIVAGVCDAQKPHKISNGLILPVEMKTFFFYNNKWFKVFI
jgi:hypothetical protein